MGFVWVKSQRSKVNRRPSTFRLSTFDLTTMMEKRRITGWWLTITLFTAVAAMGQVFELERRTVDGGGVMRSTGGDFELSGTIGQSDAGPGVLGMSGGDFTLTGGFWFALDPGDCNEDGGVNLFDFDVLEVCISGPGGGILSPECICFDVDRNGSVDMRDISIFQRRFSG